MSPVAPAGERSIGDLFRDLAAETSTLFRQEAKLATTEMAQKAKYASRQAVYVAFGGLVGLLALQAILAALVIGLGALVPLWAAALLVGAILAVVALGIAIKGITALKLLDPAPTQTLLTFEDNKSWAKKQLQ